ncbi:MAG: hypothetical protein LBD64_04630 [Odoribacteraceae bacterium]|jgi:hypothetical protein|nr:hypothetical protein [Odoribacteraceae bacterium]
MINTITSEYIISSLAFIIHGTSCTIIVIMILHVRSRGNYRYNLLSYHGIIIFSIHFHTTLYHFTRNMIYP